MINIFARYTVFQKITPPTDETAFLNFAKSLRSDIIHQGIANAEPQNQPKAFVKNESTYRYYAEAGKWPQGFLVTGDAVCSFNPIYGQGMTAALLAAESLAKSAAHGNSDNTAWVKNAQRNIVQAYRSPWTISTNEDLRWPATEGPKTGVALRTMHKFSNLIGIAAAHNQHVAYTYIQVLHMTATPAALLTPLMLARILKSGLRKKSRL
ncbi:hypothetical protein [Sulfurirhabdus autotrophica]|uniref:Flavin-dependent dehydrogenase n=1 Tax=Sulfurirhabdus autotrophica TaxID=1706046 RepID=A0A4R3XR42_9PROT|nr:hypothetical protein [Sulfurirhabdus autotrophica]TCV79980.1 hypothetical protein EDC63_13225 [Sulfurirhabdus autotrophica]